MKKLKNMTLEELLEFDKNHPVLSKHQLKYQVVDNISSYLCLLYTIPFPLFVNSLLINPSIINVFLTEISLSASIITTSNTIYNVKRKKTFTINNYSGYIKTLPLQKELKRLYNKVLDDLINEISKSPFDKDPLSIAILIGDYLIPNGMLSYTQQFHAISTTHEWLQIASYDENFEISNFTEGIYILAGYGCCRHYNSLICDIFTKLGIKNDKMCCIRSSLEELKERKKNYDFAINHLVTGYLENNIYHIIDSYNHDYSIIKSQHFYYSSSRPKVTIPDLTIELFNGQSLYYQPDIPYTHFTEDEIESRKIKIENLLYDNNEIERFFKFKIDHFETLEKIAYLVPIELERTIEKERQKRI